MANSVLCAPRRVTNGREKRKPSSGKETLISDEKGALREFLRIVCTYARKHFKDPSISMGTEIDTLFSEGKGTIRHIKFFIDLMLDEFGIRDLGDINYYAENQLKDLAIHALDQIPAESRISRKALLDFISGKKRFLKREEKRLSSERNNSD